MHWVRSLYSRARRPRPPRSFFCATQILILWPFRHSPLRLAEDMAAVGAGTLNTIADLRRLEMLSCDRSSWREVVTKICER